MASWYRRRTRLSAPDLSQIHKCIDSPINGVVVQAADEVERLGAIAKGQNGLNVDIGKQIEMLRLTPEP